METRKLWKKFYGPSTLRVGLEKSEIYDSKNSSKFGHNNIVNFSKELGIYDNPEELLSISLGSTETTLLNLHLHTLLLLMRN